MTHTLDLTLILTLNLNLTSWLILTSWQVLPGFKSRHAGLVSQNPRSNPDPDPSPNWEAFRGHFEGLWGSSIYVLLQCDQRDTCLRQQLPVATYRKVEMRVMCMHPWRRPYGAMWL